MSGERNSGIAFINHHWSGLWHSTVPVYRKLHKNVRESIRFVIGKDEYHTVLSVYYESDSYSPSTYHLVCRALYKILKTDTFALLIKDHDPIVIAEYEFKFSGDYYTDYDRLIELFKRSNLKERLLLLERL